MQFVPRAGHMLPAVETSCSNSRTSSQTPRPAPTIMQHYTGRRTGRSWLRRQCFVVVACLFKSTGILRGTSHGAPDILVKSLPSLAQTHQDSLQPTSLPTHPPISPLPLTTTSRAATWATTTYRRHTPRTNQMVGCSTLWTRGGAATATARRRSGMQFVEPGWRSFIGAFEFGRERWLDVHRSQLRLKFKLFSKLSFSSMPGPTHLDLDSVELWNGCLLLRSSRLFAFPHSPPFPRPLLALAHVQHSLHHWCRQSHLSAIPVAHPRDHDLRSRRLLFRCRCWEAHWNLHFCGERQRADRWPPRAATAL
ncbi:hypothetical protein FB45DRAFT_501047 [Roridomyces roridus]|uniref:Uncharacterized protein n=1 Tax=Roridomyces roridus TaxID=1738132 RepID=A0AAD7BVY8_9AGAR|nr:hypothetical protein FB45DRAFT_501047 [Roridomyces roridus]